MDNKVRVFSTFGESMPLGMIEPQLNMLVRSGIEDRRIVALDSGNFQVGLALTMSGVPVGKNYPFYLAINSGEASHFGWPTSNGSVYFGHRHGFNAQRLRAGSVSSNGEPTSNHVFLIASAPSGGDGSYTIQWYRDTTSGFTPSEDTIMPETTLEFVDDDVTPGRDYYYKVVYTSDSQTATSDEYHAVTPGVLLSDLFTGVNGTNLTAHPMDVGPGWTTPSGTWTISSNKAVVTGDGGDFAVSDAGTADIDLVVDVNVPNATNYAMGLVVRFLNAANRWTVALERDASGTPYVGLFERNADNNTAHGTANLPSITNTTVRLQVSCTDEDITVYVDGIQKIHYASASFQKTLTTCGLIAVVGSGYVAGSFDNLSAYPYSGDAPVPPGVGGQTLIWRAGFDHQETIDSGAPTNFSSVTGTGYVREVGPRVGTQLDDSWPAPGWSLRVPSDFEGVVPLSDAGAQNCGMLCGWVNVASCTIDPSAVAVRGRPDDGAIVGSFVVERTTVGEPEITLSMYDAFNNFTGATNVAAVNEWVYFCVAWQYAAPNFKWRAYYMLPGETTPTQIGTERSVAADYRLGTALVHAKSAEFAFVAPWRGAIGGVSLYALDAIATAATYPKDILVPTDAGQVWCVDPVAGSDSNSGFGAGEAWLTVSKVITEMNRGTILGGVWVDESGDAAGLATLETAADMEDWRLDYRDDNRAVTGDIIEVRGGPLLTASRINLEDHPGVTLRAAAGGSITIMQDLGSVFTQPNSGSYPNVWQKLGSTYGGIDYPGAGTDAGGVGYENTRLMSPVAGANLAAVLSTLNTTPGACYADANGFYFSTFSGSNPNSDGKTRRVPYCLVDNGAVGNPVIALGDNLLKDIAVEAGPVYQYISDAPVPQYVVNAAMTYLSVIDGATLSQGSYHSSGLTGTVDTGAHFEFDVTHKRMWTFGGATTCVTYTSLTTDSIRVFTCLDGVVDESVQNSGGEASPYISHDSYTCHSNNGRELPCFATRIVDCNFSGNANEVLNQDGEFTVLTSVMPYLITTSPGATADRCEFIALNPTAAGSDLTLTNCILRYDANYAAVARSISGEMTLDRCTIDFTGFTGSMLSDGGNFTLNLSSFAVIANGTNASLVSNAESSGDTISVDHTAFLGNAAPTVLTNYNDGSTTANRTYANGVTLTIITNSAVSASTGLDSNSDYAVQGGSPVIGVATSGSNVVDFTGTSFTTRNDAAAREL